MILIMIPNTNNCTKDVIRRKSSQRDLILKAVHNGHHPSARDIFEHISGKNRMSYGTVYRNLQILVEEGEIIAIKTDPEVLHYAWRVEPHHHMLCKKCGRVFDVLVPYRQDIDTEAELTSGFIIDSHAIAFEGFCSDCKSI